MGQREFRNGARAAASKVGKNTGTYDPQVDIESGYRVLRYAPTYAPNLTQFDISGDTVHVAELNGSLPLYVRFSDPRFPWVRLREGSTFRRRFSRFWLRCADPGYWDAGTPRLTDALIYVSFGDFVVSRPVKEYGLRRGFRAFRGTAPAFPSYTDLTSALLIGLPDVKTIGKASGGSLYLMNDDPGMNRLLFNYAVTPSFPIFPGQCYPLQIEQRLSSEKSSGNPASSATDNILVSGESGPCNFHCLLSGFEIDLFDPVQPRGITPV